MANAFEAIVIAVTVAGILLALTVWSPFRAMRQLGHQGGAWFDHEEDRPLADRAPDGDKDPPIPFRPLRARM